MDWLTEITYQHQELESPKSFWKWSAIAAISAVVRDNIWLDRAEVFKLYPNIYVMLHAESGMKKGPPVSMAKQLVSAVNNTKVISGRSSIQGILKEMGTAHTAPGGKIIAKSTVFICSSELSSSIVEDKVATKILTDLYDRQYNVGEWRSLLKMESFNLKDPTVTMLTATNEAMSDDFFTRSAIQGGYFARTFIVHESEEQTSNSLIYPLLNPPNYKQSSKYLTELAKLNGPFRNIASLTQDTEYHIRKIKKAGRVEREIFFSTVGGIYDDWYDDFKLSLRKQETRDETGTLNRFGDSVLKVAMLLSLAKSPSLELTEEAMIEAIAECEKLVGNVRAATRGKSGSSDSALLKNLIITELLNREPHQITREMLMKIMWMHFTGAEEFDDVMQSFNASGMITTSVFGNHILYTMPDNQVKEMQRFISGKDRKDKL